MKATCESYVDIYAPTVFVALQSYLQVTTRVLSKLDDQIE
jgi:hypothetical protein